MAATSQATSRETSTAPAKSDAYLVVARFHNVKSGNKIDFPTYTVLCDDPDEAIDFVLSQGFCFSYGAWTLRAIHVGIISQFGEAGGKG